MIPHGRTRGGEDGGGRSCDREERIKKATQKTLCTNQAAGGLLVFKSANVPKSKGKGVHYFYFIYVLPFERSQELITSYGTNVQLFLIIFSQICYISILDGVLLQRC